MAEEPTEISTDMSAFPSPRRHHHFSQSPAAERAVHPQWSHQETAELISIRAALERDFNASKRNKVLWETVSAVMRERGYNRSPEQCKCKWKSLVNRYKGKETTSDPNNDRQFPFFNELHAIFIHRAKGLQQLFTESEGASTQSKKRMKKPTGDQSSDELSGYEDDRDDFNKDTSVTSSNPRKRKSESVLDASSVPVNTGFLSISSTSSVQEMLREFFKQQELIDIRWRESMEKKQREREMFEQEWRQTMEKLERERLMAEQAWREKEEEWKTREEIRAEKRDALLTTLLNKLINEDTP